MAELTFTVDISADDVAAVEAALATLGDAVSDKAIDAEAKTVKVTTTASAEDVLAALKTLGKDVAQA